MGLGRRHCSGDGPSRSKCSWVELPGALLVFTGVKRFATEVDSILRKIIVGCLLLAGALLFLDLGAKLQAFRFFLSWRPDSVIFWGTWIFALSLLAGILRFRVPGAVFGFGLMLYPGLLLVSMSGRSALWGAWVPLEFLMLSLASGVAVVMLVDPAVRNRGLCGAVGRLRHSCHSTRSPCSGLDRGDRDEAPRIFASKNFLTDSLFRLLSKYGTGHVGRSR